MIGIYHKNLEKQRQGLIGRLVEYRKLKGHDIVVVFDGWKSGGGQENQSVTGNIRVIYSRLGETADSVIKRIISNEKKHWIVVTSDRDIADYAWSCNSVALSSDEFLRALEKSKNVMPGDFEFLDSEDDELPGKGSTKKLSKKEKARQRALSKL